MQKIIPFRHPSLGVDCSTDKAQQYYKLQEQ